MRPKTSNGMNHVQRGDWLGPSGGVLVDERKHIDVTFFIRGIARADCYSCKERGNDVQSTSSGVEPGRCHAHNLLEDSSSLCGDAPNVTVGHTALPASR
jgi:hypothetical protein